eukprot:429493-Hanusia_phi.AAC.1
MSAPIIMLVKQNSFLLLTSQASSVLNVFAPPAPSPRSPAHMQLRSFWCPCDSQPRCALEKLAMEVFQHHTRRAKYDAQKSGVEWWVQESFPCLLSSCPVKQGVTGQETYGKQSGGHRNALGQGRGSGGQPR